MSNSLQTHGLQHARSPCPSPSPRVCSNSCPLKSVITSNHLILRHCLLHLPLIFPSITVFSNESALHITWPKYWSFSFSISLSKESVQFNLVTQSNSLQPHGRQHTRLSCTSPTPRACSNSCPCVMTSNQLILCHPLLLLPSVLPIIRVFSNESLCIRWPTYWSFSFSINPCNEYPGLIF